MNFWKRAAVSIWRRKSKNMILLLVSCILAIIVFGALSIVQTMNNVQQLIKDNVGSMVTFEPDLDHLLNISPEDTLDVSDMEPGVSLETIEYLGSLPQVKDFDYSLSGSYIFRESSIQNYHDPDVLRSGDYTEFYVTGTHKSEILALSNGNAVLSAGRLFTADELKQGAPVVIIDQRVAELNDISVGDNIEMASPLLEEEINDRFEYTVIGIIAMNINANQNIEQSMINETLINTIYMPNNTAIKVFAYRDKKSESDKKTLYGVPIYILNSYQEMEEFCKIAEPYQPIGWKIKSSAELLQKISGPLTNLSWVTQMILICAVSAIILILGLLILLFLYDRRHELGIYLSLGEQKSTVIIQVFVETITIILLAMTLAGIAGQFIATTVSDAIIKENIISRESETMAAESIFGNGFDLAGLDFTLSDAEIKAAYQIDFGAATYLTYYLIGITSASVAIMIPLIYVLRLKPKKILL